VIQERRSHQSDDPDTKPDRGTTRRTARNGELDRDDIFDVLSNGRRRYAIEYLKGHDEGETIELGDLVDYIAARENDTTVKQVSYKQRKRVYSSLRQTHLPKLSDCGLVEYDRERGTIALAEGVKKVQMHLEYVPEDDIPWCYHYLGLAGIMGTVVGLVWLRVYPFSDLTTAGFGTILTAAFGISAVVHTIHTKQNELGSDLEVDR
jgi:DNA-binding transcriptional ArsR family regulator